MLLAAPAALACSDDTQDFYAHVRAFLRVYPVTSAPQLHTALNNPGMFCKVTFTTRAYIFTDAFGQSSEIARTALDAYGRPECVAGFITGMPAIPDMQGRMECVAYDLVCPNCYLDLIERALTFASATTVSCPRCRRTYDLGNGGIVTGGENGQKLLRYHLTYSPAQNVLFIQN